MKIVISKKEEKKVEVSAQNCGTNLLPRWPSNKSEMTPTQSTEREKATPQVRPHPHPLFGP